MPAPAGRSSAAETILLLEARRADALISGDVRYLDQITHEDLLHVDGLGTLRDKAAFLRSIANGAAWSRRYETSNIELRVTRDTAVVTGLFANERTPAGGEAQRRFGRFSRVYVRREGLWLNLLHQGTEIRE